LAGDNTGDHVGDPLIAGDHCATSFPHRRPLHPPVPAAAAVCRRRRRPLPRIAAPPTPKSSLAT